MTRRTAWMRSLLLCALLLLLAAGLAACRTAQLDIDEASSERIVLVAPVHAEEQGNAMRLGAEAAAKEYGVELDYAALDQNEDASGQLGAALQAVLEGASAVLIDPADEQVLKELALSAAAAGAPIVALNDERMGAGVRAAIAIDNTEAGRQAGEALAEQLHGKGTVAIIQSERSDPDLERRAAGARAALAEYEQIHVTDGTVCGDVRVLCRQLAKQMLDRERLDGVLALEVSASLGVADEVMRRGEQGTLKLVAFGSELEQLELLQDGVIHKLVVQNGFSSGYLGVEHAVKLLGGAQYEQPTLLETRVIDVDNMFWMNNQKMLFPFIK